MSANRRVITELAAQYDPNQDKRIAHASQLHAFRLRNPRPSPADKYRIWASVYRPLSYANPDSNFQDLLRKYASTSDRSTAIHMRNILERYVETASREDAEYEAIAVPLTEQFEKRYYKKKRMENSRLMRQRVNERIQRKTYKSRVMTQPHKQPQWGITPAPQLMYKDSWHLVDDASQF